MEKLLTLLLFYFLIIFSIIGYGNLFSQIFKRIYSIGERGLVGILSLIIISYITNLFFPHSLTHNSLIITLGLLIFVFYTVKNFRNNIKELLPIIVVFLILFIGLLMQKNHDDFYYYHFSYILTLIEYKKILGLGLLNHGFRTPSSIFYLNSLFYLPFAKFHLFHFTPVYILGFANIILLKNIHHYFAYLKVKTKDINITNYLSLFSLIFINIFFYRIAEHGTDRSAQILIFLLIIELLMFINLKNIKSSNLFKLYLLASLIISLKAFYILYAIFFIPLMLFMRSQNQNYIKTISFLILNKFFALFLLMLFFALFTYFINTGCVIYPLSVTCFDSISWSISSADTLKMNNHYELWSKGGSTPNSRVMNPEEYIQGFYWVKNWINIYFFTKVSDFILGLVLLVVIVVSFFKKQFFEKKTSKVNNYVYLIYLIIAILGLEWFFNHPALRYGGYCIIALLFFIPVCLKLEVKNVDYKNYNKSVVILIIITILVFNLRNINRINKEVDSYNYKPVKQTFYFVDDENFRIQKNMKRFITQYDDCKKSKDVCDLKMERIYKKYGKIIFKNR